jgi:23S rRNA pseudouridine1911/1915/1917 synthase
VKSLPRTRGTTWHAANEAKDVRLDKFLAGPDRLGSRSRALAALERGKVFLNDAPVGVEDAGRRLVATDAVRVWMDRPGSARPKPRPRDVGDVTIIHEDADVIVVNKPAGLLTVPLERKADADSVESQLAEHLRRRRRRPLVVHRIDRDTSGLVLFAANAVAQRKLRDQFRRHTVERVYLAVVYGTPSPARGTWRDRLVWDQRALIQKETHPRDPAGRDAVSEYRVLKSLGAASLLEVRLVTGKRNQIRLQARLRGHTLVGEQRYTFGPDELRTIDFGRQALHAQRLVFVHPSTNETLTFEAPLPPDMAELIARCSRPGSGSRRGSRESKQ